jgi:hypothetical protein
VAPKGRIAPKDEPGVNFALGKLPIALLNKGRKIGFTIPFNFL